MTKYTCWVYLNETRNEIEDLVELCVIDFMYFIVNIVFQFRILLRYYVTIMHTVQMKYEIEMTKYTCAVYLNETR